MRCGIVQYEVPGALGCYALSYCKATLQRLPRAFTKEVLCRHSALSHSIQKFRCVYMCIRTYVHIGYVELINVYRCVCTHTQMTPSYIYVLCIFTKVYIHMQTDNALRHVSTHIHTQYTHHTLKYIHLQALTYTDIHTCLWLTMQCTMYHLLYTVLLDTSLGQYVFVPVATEYYPQTDHLSNPTVIHGCRFVCLCLWHCCRLILLPPARLQPPSGPSSLSSISTFFNPSSMARNLLLYVPVSFPSLRLPGHSSVWILSFLSLFLLSQFFSPPSLCNPTISLPLCPRPLSSFPSFCPPASDLVHSRTQYCIDWFPSVLSDLAVIVPERSWQIDFSEKDTVMFGNLLLHSAN